MILIKSRRNFKFKSLKIKKKLNDDDYVNNFNRLCDDMNVFYKFAFAFDVIYNITFFDNRNHDKKR